MFDVGPTIVILYLFISYDLIFLLLLDVGATIAIFYLRLFLLNTVLCRDDAMREGGMRMSSM